MAWLGFATFITIYGCFFTTQVTGRLEWTLLSVWCAPVLFMCLSYKTGMEINGLLVLICVLLFLICRRSLTGVRMWNLKMRHKHRILFGFTYVLCMTFLFYALWQIHTQGYTWIFHGDIFKDFGYIGIMPYVILIILVAYPLSHMLYNSVDRTVGKEKELILLECKFFIAKEQGAEWGFWKGYFLDGIHNGISYHFRMTQRMYYMLRKERTLVLSVRTGLLGGLYVVKNPCPDNVKKTRRRDRRNLKVGIIGGIMTMAVGIWLFWFL